jgi:hypothetical protein
MKKVPLYQIAKLIQRNYLKKVIENANFLVSPF